MKPPEEEAFHRIVNDWLYKADQDIRSAETLLVQEAPLLYPSCFHAQQAAEKYLKAYLTWHQIEFPKTHSIRELINLLRQADEQLAIGLQSAAELTPYGVEVRYPGDQPEPTIEEARHALELAKHVRKAILEDLQEHI